MENYHVLQKCGDYQPRLIRSFCALKQAVNFVELMRASEDNKYTKYFICELMPEND